MRLWLACRAFFVVLFDAQRATRIAALLTASESPPGEGATASAAAAADRVAPAPRPVEPPRGVQRSDALNLLAALQREARLVDIVREDLSAYSDQQIGAAARDVLRDCGTVLERLFALQPLVNEAEGAQVETPVPFDPGRYRITGNVAGEPPFRGRLVHHGWQATRCELPQWSGSQGAAMVVAPVELEID